MADPTALPHHRGVDMQTQGRPAIHFLVSSPEAQGGIARATATLANMLVRTYPVTVIGLKRMPATRPYAFDADVEVRHVTDLAPSASRWLEKAPALRDGMTRRHGYSALVDLMLPRVLRSLPPGVVVSTRPRLHLAAARYAPEHCRTIGQEHVNFVFRSRHPSRRHMDAIENLDQFVVLTEADAHDYRTSFPRAADRIRVIRNPAPWPIGTPQPDREDVVVAAGQLGLRKGFDRLIAAFEPVAKQRPGWRLDIYGAGPRRPELRDLIGRLGLADRVRLCGQTDRMDRVLERASIFALSSRHEGLPMVLIEAMTKGVPSVSFDCPRGPAEIVVPGKTGLLVEDGDISGMTTALMRLIDSPELRRQMEQTALNTADLYTSETVVRQWTSLVDQLTTNVPITAGAAS